MWTFWNQEEMDDLLAAVRAAVRRETLREVWDKLTSVEGQWITVSDENFYEWLASEVSPLPHTPEGKI